MKASLLTTTSLTLYRHSLKNLCTVGSLLVCLKAIRVNLGARDHPFTGLLSETGFVMRFSVTIRSLVTATLTCVPVSSSANTIGSLSLDERKALLYSYPSEALDVHQLAHSA